MIISTVYSQDIDLIDPKANAPKLDAPKFEPLQRPTPDTLPVLGRLTDEQKAEIINSLVDAKSTKVPDIFSEPMVEVDPVSPETVYKMIVNDLNTNVSPENRLFTRYLSLYAIEPKDRIDHATISSFVVNSLSWSHAIMWPEMVPGTDNGLLRFRVDNYSRDEKDIQRWLATWELMTSADVYFLEPWVNRDDALAAQELSGSVGCVLRADWFNYYAMNDDDPATKNAVEGFYSKFLGLPDTEAELFKLLKINLKDIAENGSDRSYVVPISGEGSDAPKVGRSNRKLNRFPTILTAYGGYFHFTQDVINSQGKRNFLNNPLSTFKDGGEYIWRLPNGLQGYYLTQREEIKKNDVVVAVKFNRISEVPINVAVDPHFEDGRVKIRSCAHCHKNGINKAKDAYQDVLLATRPPGGIIKPNPKNLDDELRLKQLYYPDKDAYFSADQINYQQSLFLATGMTPDKFVTTYKRCLDFYDSPVTPQRAVWEFGVAGGVAGLEVYLADKVVSTTKGSLLLLVKGGSIQRDSFEEEYKNGKLLQEIKKNIIPKNGTNQVNLVVPSTIVGTAQGSGLNITEHDAYITTTDKDLIASGSTNVIGTVPSGVTLKILRRYTGSNGSSMVYVEYGDKKGWIRLD